MENQKIPVLLLTGYLGSGKTTLVNRILSNRKGIRFAVIVNDIGEVNIDADLIQAGGVVAQKDDSLVALQNGCICCTLKADLIEQMFELTKMQKFDYVVIEASGICEPEPIAQTICSIPSLGGPYTKYGTCHIDCIVTVVDALRLRDEFGGGDALTGQDIGEEDIANLIIQQIEFCNIILLNKASEVKPEELEKTKAIIRTLQPVAEIIDCDYADVDLDKILHTGLFDFDRAATSAGWIRGIESRPTDEEAMKDYEAARRYLYSCYSYLPRANNLSDNMELLTADELISTTDNFKFFDFMRGNYTPSNPILSHWTQFYNGIRHCYLFLENIDRVSNWPSADVKLDFESQGKFLIAYYHYRLCREYGPIILLDRIGDLGTPVGEYKARSSYDACVEFICKTLEEAAEGLPATRSGRDYGLFTSTAAYALSAKMRLFAASPLYNGNSEYYSDFKDADGNPLIAINYDSQKWETAKAALKKAIDFAHSNGYNLYRNTTYNEGNLEPLDPTQHCLRNIMIEAGNPEIIMADCRSEYYWDVQNASFPYSRNVTFSSHGPSLTMLDRFYTKNGLLPEKDPSFPAKSSWFESAELESNQNIDRVLSDMGVRNSTTMDSESGEYCCFV